jgi:hypothetical protein
MERVTFVSYHGKSILIEDFSHLQPGREMLDTIARAQAVIAAQPPHSVLAVFDASGAHFDTETMAAMKAFVTANNPYMKCAAVVGISGLLNIALFTLAKASGRSFRSFESREAAMAYLVEQK